MSDILTLDGGWSQRASSYRFELLNSQLEYKGVLEVDMDRPPSFDNNINRTIKRSMTGLYISPSDASEVNPLADRLRIIMDIKGDQEYPLGVFIFANLQREGTGRVWRSVTLVDQLKLLDTPMARGWGVPPGSNVGAAIGLWFEMNNIPVYNVESTAYTVRGSEWLVWPAGGSGIDPLYDLCDLAGFYSAYFDNEGTGIARSVEDLESVDPAYTYGEGDIHVDQLTRTNDLMDAPNRFIVISNSADYPIDGYWDVPASAPHSIQNRGGRVIAKTYDVQGVESQAQATRIAKAKGQSDASTYEWLDFSMEPDPRLDTFDIIGVETEEGDSYHVQSTGQRAKDGLMDMEVRRIYRDPVP